jgi:hypothetical protein
MTADSANTAFKQVPLVRIMTFKRYGDSSSLFLERHVTYVTGLHIREDCY